MMKADVLAAAEAAAAADDAAAAAAGAAAAGAGADAAAAAAAGGAANDAAAAAAGANGGNGAATLTRMVSINSGRRQLKLSVKFAGSGGDASGAGNAAGGGLPTISSTASAATTPLGRSPVGADGLALAAQASVGGGKQQAWRRKLLFDLQERGTAFSSTELEVLIGHFQEAVSSLPDGRVTRDAFLSSLGAAFGTTDERLLGAIFTAIDSGGSGSASLADFVDALSVVFRGDADTLLGFWFAMYDSDHDGFLTHGEFERLLQDVNRTAAKAVQVAVEEVFADDDGLGGGGGLDGLSLEEEERGGGGSGEQRLLSYEEFVEIMQEYDVLPIFASPHRFAQHKQLPALRALSPPEREVLLLLGTQVNCRAGASVIKEGEALSFFFFLLEGEVSLSRGGILLGSLAEGSFVGESALFSDIKSPDEAGDARFTTAVDVSSATARVLRLAISDFTPLVHHQHPGAVAIVQRLGRIMLERVQQTEERLSAILAGQAKQSEAGMRLSSRDWAAFRKKLTRSWALKYHRVGRPGKLEVMPTKMMGSKEDLSVAYSPGVAEPCLAIQADEKYAYEYTARGHLVGVITNGTAVLGLGDIGPLAGKPVMEGKACLLKHFADIDAFDLEVAERDPQRLVDLVCALEPTFGGINLEDIKSPECFFVETEAQRRMSIPVFHDDQHGTAIVAGAGLLNSLELVGKDIAAIRVVVCGCGAAGFTCAKYFVSLGVRKEHVLAVDVKGVVYRGRDDLVADPASYLHAVAVDTPKRTLAEAVAGADVFLGLSAGNLLTPEMLLTMAPDPLVFALANPVPEIDPDLAAATRGDVIMATGRSDFPNQINNVCAFPFIFRGALDVRARCVNEEMKRAATHAIAALARRPAALRRRVPSVGDLLHLTAASLQQHQEQQQTQEQGQQQQQQSGRRTPSPPPAQDQQVGNGHAGAAADSSGAGSRASPLHHHHHHRHTASGGSNNPLRRKSHGETGGSASTGTGTTGGDAIAAGGQQQQQAPVFSRQYIIPKPFDERLLPEVSAAVAEAAIASGVARVSAAEFDAAGYRRSLVDLGLRMAMM